MLVSKKEFKEIFGFKSASSVSHLLDSKKIIADEQGRIDLDDKINKKWVRARNKKLKENKPAEATKPTKSENQIGLEIEILNQKLNERQKKATLLDLKIAKERKEVVEIDVLNRVITSIFDSLFKNLAELPSVYVDDVVNIIRTNKEPKEICVKFLTDKILNQIRSGLEIAENVAKKYYE